MTSSARLLIYSHDSFGLGHLRRCRAIAHHLVERYKNLSILILSGSPIVGSFDYRARVDFVRVPGVIKLRNGDYEPLSLHLDLEHTLALRASIIRHTAEAFDPHLFLVDKEPLGLRGEVEPTLRVLKRRGARLVLGLRDVMDEPASLVREWRRKNVFPALRRLYDEIWVYGLPEIFDPLAEIPGMADLKGRVAFTGYLPRGAPEPTEALPAVLPDRPYLLVTPGGGGDGAELIEAVLAAYERAEPAPPALLVLGPFMPSEQRARFLARAEALPKLRAMTFDARIERLIEGASGLVAMGGYNTFCEILSFGKPALILPRTEPRREQQLRAERAEALGLLRVIPDAAAADPARMAALLNTLPAQPAPNLQAVPGLLDGLERIADLAAPWLAPRRRRRFG